ncbi:NAD(P)-dependent oxidoreductase [Pseudomonas granadensis]|uniref:NAD(P)-dependent oxidoreductase n=1 Tax=Pseudomonas granadensis TaxID=1421430 RepID=A0ABX7GAQ0_9PSED|nr:NAD(P)-dependent oxidoreductase [Pseudomonas granadensis]MBN6776101.1 NAD(P)-dependent oxidoreductase [Pseudomonas granadensis]MBN6807119.1 NAD(P)-dependent oxidoreductase [Pseudomonas granadensis]MBN6834033.1 NAD(P)-dependent oxidoreductase [Pseudomonas granadensis]MBN6841494.1 NAD(P)-dependent oxidoreductase [Pseudomonas granadensis]MBN6870221.1 NAD(P)-dependent oxidoreductase [Pseudomonas granadensis]
MSVHPILFMGGSGAIGHRSAKALRAAHPDVPLLIGGRDLAKAQQAAEEMGGAQGVVIDPAAEDLGLGDRPVSAVAVFYMDHTLAGLRFAQKRRVPHLSISSGVFEMAPQIAGFIHTPNAAPIVLGYEWMVGATTVATLHLAKAFARVRDICINALVDEQDGGGPTVAADFEHLNRMLPAALTRREGAYVWREGEEANVSFRALDGTLMQASGFSSIDVAGLAAATDAANVQFNLASGVSSSRRAGRPMSTEILIEMAGEGPDGQALHTRHALVHPAGAAALTGLSIAMLLVRLIGLDGAPPTAPGLYFPYQLLDAAGYLQRLGEEGGELLELSKQ